MKEVSPQTSSPPDNSTFRCCKSTMFILQTCFISLSFFLFGFRFWRVGDISHVSLAHPNRIRVVGMDRAVAGGSVSRPDD